MFGLLLVGTVFVIGLLLVGSVNVFDLFLVGTVTVFGLLLVILLLCLAYYCTIMPHWLFIDFAINPFICAG